MSKAVKLKNDNYLDSTGIVHNKRLLSDMIGTWGNTTWVKLPITQYVGNCDLNDLVNQGSGIFTAFGACSNAPTNNGNVHFHWYVLQMCYGTDYCVQICTALHSDTSKIYMRHKIGGNWSGWVGVNFS